MINHENYKVRQFWTQEEINIVTQNKHQMIKHWARLLPNRSSGAIAVMKTKIKNGTYSPGIRRTKGMVFYSLLRAIGLSHSALCQKDKSPTLVLLRQCFSYIAKNEDVSISDIARYLQQHHASVLYSVKIITETLNLRPDVIFMYKYVHDRYLDYKARDIEYKNKYYNGE